MQRIAFASQDAPCKSSTKTMHAAVQESAREIEGPPAPGELFFESGIVVAIALAAGMLVQLIMATA